MHPAVCSFVASTFYDGSLTTNPSIRANRVDIDVEGLYWLDYIGNLLEEGILTNSQKNNFWMTLLNIRTYKGLMNRG